MPRNKIITQFRLRLRKKSSIECHPRGKIRSKMSLYDRKWAPPMQLRFAR
jgi:hypothetical protein